jgi:hypothetical protein
VLSTDDMMFLDNYYHNNNEASSFAMNRKSCQAPTIHTCRDMLNPPLSSAKSRFIDTGMSESNLIYYFLKLAFSSNIVLLDLLTEAATQFPIMLAGRVYSMKASNESSKARKVQEASF